MPFIEGAGLSVHQVSVAFPQADSTVKVLRDVSCELRSPTTAVLGLNGSGKSTFLKLFNGLVEPTAGTVSVNGLTVEEHLMAVRRHVGLLFSDPQAQLIMPTPVEDVELSLRRSVSDIEQRRQRALQILAQRGLAHRAHHSVYDLSGGERQLAALSAVLAVEPRVLLLDEPTTLLDLQNKLKLLKLLESLDQQLVISTHDLELAATCNEALVIHRGRLIAQGPSSAVIADYRRWCAEGFPGDEPDAS